jgi:hypothetical protein
VSNPNQPQEPFNTSTPWGGMPPTHVPPPVKPKRNGWKIATVVLAVLACIATGAALSSDGDSASGADAPTPTPSAQTPPVNPAQPAPRPVTKTVTKEVVPQVCLDALDAADKNVEAFTFIVDWSQRFLGAIGDADVEAATELNNELTASTESGKYAGIIPEYELAAKACRAVN